MNPRLRLASALLLGALSACTADAEKQWGPATPGEFIFQLEAVFLARVQRCGSPFYEVPLGPGRYGEVMDESFAAGRLGYDEEKALLCLKVIWDAPCEDPTLPGERLEECGGIITPRVDPGGACNRSECRNGWCDTSASCPGVCTARSEEGEGCAGRAYNLCAKGLYCGPDEKCRRSKGHLEACAEGIGCMSPFICADGICVRTDWRDSLADEGEACGTCKAGLYCDGAVDRYFSGVYKTALCKPLPAPAEGDPCDLDRGCGPLACRGYSATSSGTCAKWGAVGEPCLEFPANDGITGCQIGLACVDGRCQVPRTSGPCYSDPFRTNICAPQVAHCSGGECRLKGAKGEACSSSSGCLYGSTCEDGFCQPLSACSRY